MYTNTLFVFFFSFIIKLKTDNTFTAIHSYLDEKQILNVIPSSVQKKIESIYIGSFGHQPSKIDPICTLSNERKKMLCKLVFDLHHYKTLGIDLNKVSLYLAELSCQERSISFRYINIFNSNLFKQNMYPCYGRHEIVHTSFIEDDYYNRFYLSFGTNENSVTVYTHTFNKNLESQYHVYDYIYDIDISQISDILISVKDIIKELKLTNITYSMYDVPKIEDMYIKELNNIKNNIICDLKYEKKLSLCKIVLEENSKNKIKVSLNKSAAYILSTNCITKPIQTFNKETKTLLNEKQELFPCYSRQTNRKDNLLTDPFIFKYFVSTGPKRNSVLVYSSLYPWDFEKSYFSIYGLVANVNIKTLNSTTINEDEMIEESSSNYKKVKILVDIIQMTHSNDFSVIIEESIFENSHGKENEKMKKLIDKTQNNIEKMVSTLDIETNIGEKVQSIVPKIEKKENEVGEETEVFVSWYDIFRVTQIGSQIFKKLLEEKRSEIKEKLNYRVTSTELFGVRARLQKRILQKFSPSTDWTQKVLENDKQNLINKMQIYVTDDIKESSTINIQEKQSKEEIKKSSKNVKKKKKKKN